MSIITSIISLINAIPFEVLFIVLGIVVAFSLFCNGYVAGEVAAYHDPYDDSVDWYFVPFYQKWERYLKETFVEDRITRFFAKTYFFIVSIGALVSKIREKFNPDTNEEGSV